MNIPELKAILKEIRQNHKSWRYDDDIRLDHYLVGCERELQNGRTHESIWDLATILEILRINGTPTEYEHYKNAILDGLQSEYPVFTYNNQTQFLNKLYTHRLWAADLLPYTAATFDKIQDIDAVGTGNVVVDFALRNHWFDSRIAQIDDTMASIIANHIVLFPDLTTKFASISQSDEAHMSKYEYEMYKKCPISPLCHKLTSSQYDFDRSKENMKSALQKLLRHEKIAENVAFLIVNSDNSQSLIDKLKEYNCLDIPLRKIPEAVEYYFMEHKPVSYDSDTAQFSDEQKVATIKATVAMARDLYLKYNQADLHLDYVAILLTTIMMQGVTYSTTGKDPNEIIALIKLPNDAAGNAKFAAFLNSISIIESNKPKYTA